MLLSYLQGATAEPLRVWSSADGKSSAQAEYVDIKGSNVLLLKQNGRLISVPFAKLSIADNRYIVQRIRDAKAAKNAPVQAPVPIAAPAGAQNPPAVLPAKVNVVLSEDDALKSRNERALEDTRKANLRTQQSRANANGTKLNTLRSQKIARGQAIIIERQQLEQQVLEHRAEISDRNADMRSAEEAGAWEYVSGHQTQIALLRNRIAEREQRYVELGAEWIKLDQEVAGLNQQIAALEDEFYGIEEEIAVQPAQVPPVGK
jgi:hypothetical protein